MKIKIIDKSVTIGKFEDLTVALCGGKLYADYSEREESKFSIDEWNEVRQIIKDGKIVYEFVKQ